MNYRNCCGGEGRRRYASKEQGTEERNVAKFPALAARRLAAGRGEREAVRVVVGSEIQAQAQRAVEEPLEKGFPSSLCLTQWTGSGQAVGK